MKTTHPTPQPAGDAALGAALKEISETTDASTEWPDVLIAIIKRAQDIETARAIQAGKGAGSTAARLALAVEMERDYTVTAERLRDPDWPDDRFPLSTQAAIRALEAALAGSQGEGVGKCPRCGTPDHVDGDGITTICACRSNTTPAPAANRSHDYVRDEEHVSTECCQRCGGTRVMTSDNHDEAECTHCPDPAAPDGDAKERFFAAMERKYGYRPQLWGNGEPINGRDFDRMDGFMLAFSDQRVGEAVAFISPESLEVLDSSRKQGRKSWVEISNDRGEDWHRREPLYLNPPAAIPDGMVVVPCQHKACTPRYDHVVCDDCGSVFTDSEWGIAKNQWFKSLSIAKFYKENGRLPDAAAPGSAEGGK